MKIKSMLCLMVLAAVFMFANGCNEEMSSDELRMARLVGNENLTLKKQAQEKDAEINDKNTLIKDKDAKIAELGQQLEQAKQQTARIQERIATLEKTFSDASASYQQQMEDCRKNLDAKPVPCTEVEEKYAAQFADLLQKWTECETKLEKYEQTDNK